MRTLGTRCFHGKKIYIIQRVREYIHKGIDGMEGYGHFQD